MNVKEIKKNHFKEIGFYNEGKYCYLNSVIQCLFHEKGLMEKILNHLKGLKLNNNYIITKLIDLYNTYITTNENNLHILRFILFFGNKYPIFSEKKPQDAQEFMLYLLGCINDEINILTNSNDNFINNLFNLTIENKLKCNICSWESRNLEKTNNIVLDIPDINNTNVIQEMVNLKFFIVKYKNLNIKEFIPNSIPIEINKNYDIGYLKAIIASSFSNLDIQNENLLSILINEKKNLIKFFLIDDENVYPYFKKNNDIYFYYLINEEKNEIFDYNNLIFIYFSQIVNIDFIFFYQYPVPIKITNNQSFNDIHEEINNFIKKITKGEKKDYSINIFHNINDQGFFFKKTSPCPLCKNLDNKVKCCNLFNFFQKSEKIINLKKYFKENPVNLIIDIINYKLSLDNFQNIENINDKKNIIFDNIKYITLQDCLNYYNKEEKLLDFICEKCHNKGIIKKSSYINNNLPEYLLIKINRMFDSEPGKNPILNLISRKYQNKNDKFVSCPFNLEYFKKNIYNLYGIIDHVSSLGFWHYYAKCRNAEGKWFLLNDHRVNEIKNNIIEKDLYLLFYAKN